MTKVLSALTELRRHVEIPNLPPVEPFVLEGENKNKAITQILAEIQTALPDIRKKLLANGFEENQHKNAHSGEKVIDYVKQIPGIGKIKHTIGHYNGQPWGIFSEIHFDHPFIKRIDLSQSSNSPWYLSIDFKKGTEIDSNRLKNKLEENGFSVATGELMVGSVNPKLYQPSTFQDLLVSVKEKEALFDLGLITIGTLRGVRLRLHSKSRPEYVKTLLNIVFGEDQKELT